MDSSPVVIKKYPNRRLYDTSTGRYINLEDVASLVRQGVDLQVVDARTGEDLTRMVLTQVIVEDAKEQPAGLPLELLRQLIVVTDRAGREFIMWYLKSAFDAYHKVQQSVGDRLTDVRSAALSPLQMVRNLFTPGSGAAEAELEQLRQKLAEMEARPTAAAPRRPRKPRSAGTRPRRSGRKGG